MRRCKGDLQRHGRMLSINYLVHPLPLGFSFCQCICFVYLSPELCCSMTAMVTSLRLRTWLLFSGATLFSSLVVMAIFSLLSVFLINTVVKWHPSQTSASSVEVACLHTGSQVASKLSACNLPSGSTTKKTPGLCHLPMQGYPDYHSLKRKSLFVVQLRTFDMPHAWCHFLCGKQKFSSDITFK